jgi:hypothetical protein
MSRRDVRWKSERPRSRPAVKKKVEVVPTPILAAPKGQAPTVAERGPLADDLRALLPRLDAAARERLVDALADVALAQLDAVNTDPDPEE